jgi:hypothetical protein
MHPLADADTPKFKWTLQSKCKLSVLFGRFLGGLAREYKRSPNVQTLPINVQKQSAKRFSLLQRRVVFGVS